MKRADASLKEDSVMMSASSGEVHSVDEEEGGAVISGGASVHHVQPPFSLSACLLLMYAVEQTIVQQEGSAELCRRLYHSGVQGRK